MLGDIFSYPWLYFVCMCCVSVCVVCMYMYVCLSKSEIDFRCWHLILFSKFTLYKFIVCIISSPLTPPNPPTVPTSLLKLMTSFKFSQCLDVPVHVLRSDLLGLGAHLWRKLMLLSSAAIYCQQLGMGLVMFSSTHVGMSTGVGFVGFLTFMGVILMSCPEKHYLANTSLLSSSYHLSFVLSKMVPESQMQGFP